jgi:hypothetical protein
MKTDLVELDKKTVAELDDAIHARNAAAEAARLATKAEIKALTVVRDRKVAEDRVAKLMANLSHNEKALLSKGLIATESVPSSERVAVPGAE